MRATVLIPWIVIGSFLSGHFTSLFAQNVATLIYDVSDMADGSITQARLEAQRQATGAGPAFRSFKKVEYRSFSGKFIPPELPEDKKGRFVYGLAVFSDDGVNVTVQGSLIHQRFGQGQHLPSIGESFHLLPVILAPGEPIDITVDYLNTIYDNDPESPGYPDIDGCTLFLYLIPAAIAVDANRDGTIAFSGEARDTTSPDAPFRFWCNDDNDGLPNSEREEVESSFPDHEDGVIQTARDLEDFTRLWVHFDAFQKEIADGSYRLGLKWKSTPGGPSINVYKSTDGNGSDSYLRDEGTALRQISANDAERIGTVSGTTTLILPAALWSGQNPMRCLLFEGSQEGNGQLVFTIQKSDGTEIGEGPGVWLDLKNIKQMYARATATPDTVIKQYESDTPNFDDSDFNFSVESYTPPPDEEKKVLVFVHGWNQPYEDSVNFAETMFKRLWHQGFRGRFCAFRWATLTGTITYNTSEYRAWKYGTSLANYIASLPWDYVKNVAAHSLGNVVTGSALQRGIAINRYFLMQAAIPGGCYSDAVNNYSLFATAELTRHTPDAVADLGYRLSLQEAYARVGKAVNFYNQLDFALATGSYPIIGSTHWEQNQLLFKPNANLGVRLGDRTYAYDSGPPSNPYPTGQRCFLRDSYPPFNQRRVTDIHESMAYIARPRSKALGAEPNSSSLVPDSVNLEEYGFGGVRSDHSGQFNRRIQEVSDFYKKLFDEMK